MKNRAFAKINLCLDVVGRREDGYHELNMVMVPIDFYDVLEMNISDKTSISVNRTFLPDNDKNTVIKAIKVMKERYGFKEEFECHLTKHIPTQAGLAGGSADGANAIRMINKLLKLNLTNEEMIDVGLEVGSDVPFCIINKPAIVRGKGEIIEPFTVNTDFEIFLVKPHLGVSTKKAFDLLNIDRAVHPDCEALKIALENNDYEGVIKNLGNSLEEPSFRIVEEIKQVKNDLLQLGFDGALMSGSGSTVFGITRDKELMANATTVMKEKGYFVRSTRIFK